VTSLFLMSESPPCRHDAIINLHHLLVFMSQQSMLRTHIIFLLSHRKVIFNQTLMGLISLNLFRVHHLCWRRVIHGSVQSSLSFRPPGGVKERNEFVTQNSSNMLRCS